jgi:hypothetical protein
MLWLIAKKQQLFPLTFKCIRKVADPARDSFQD